MAIAVETPLDLPALHSELPLVCPELRKRALELLPEREPYAFLRRTACTGSPAAHATSRQQPVGGNLAAYAGLRALQTLKLGLSLVAGLGAFAMLAELLRW